MRTPIFADLLAWGAKAGPDRSMAETMTPPHSRPLGLTATTSPRSAKGAGPRLRGLARARSSADGEFNLSSQCCSEQSRETLPAGQQPSGAPAAFKRRLTVGDGHARSQAAGPQTGAARSTISWARSSAGTGTAAWNFGCSTDRLAGTARFASASRCSWVMSKRTKCTE